VSLMASASAIGNCFGQTMIGVGALWFKQPEKTVGWAENGQFDARAYLCEQAWPVEALQWSVESIYGSASIQTNGILPFVDGKWQYTITVVNAWGMTNRLELYAPLMIGLMLTSDMLMADGMSTAQAYVDTWPWWTPDVMPKWSIVGDPLGSRIDEETGYLTAGTHGGQITIRATDRNSTNLYLDQNMSLYKVGTKYQDNFMYCRYETSKVVNVGDMLSSDTYDRSLMTWNVDTNWHDQWVAKETTNWWGNYYWIGDGVPWWAPTNDESDLEIPWCSIDLNGNLTFSPQFLGYYRVKMGSMGMPGCTGELTVAAVDMFESKSGGSYPRWTEKGWQYNFNFNPAVRSDCLSVELEEHCSYGIQHGNLTYGIWSDDCVTNYYRLDFQGTNKVEGINITSIP